MTWPEAIKGVAHAIAPAIIVYSMCRMFWSPRQNITTHNHYHGSKGDER